MKKYMIILGAFMMLLFSVSGALADGSVDDNSNDIFHYFVTGGTGGWEGSTTKSNIDIKEISYTVVGEQLTLTLKVYGTIQNSENIYYWASYNSTDTNYWMSWHNGEGAGIGRSFGGGSGSFDYDPVVTYSGDTITGVFDVLGDTSNQVLYGYAHEYTQYGDATKEWWADYAPGSYFPYAGLVDDGINPPTPPGNGEEKPSGGTTGGTPGFEILTLIVAITIAIIVLRKRK